MYVCIYWLIDLLFIYLFISSSTGGVLSETPPAENRCVAVTFTVHKCTSRFPYETFPEGKTCQSSADQLKQSEMSLSNRLTERAFLIARHLLPSTTSFNICANLDTFQDVGDAVCTVLFVEQRGDNWFAKHLLLMWRTDKYVKFAQTLRLLICSGLKTADGLTAKCP